MLSKKVEDLIIKDDVIDFYKLLGISYPAIRLPDMKLVYEKFLKECRLELVVFCDIHDDAIVFDSRLNDDDELSRLSDKVGFLWLNLNHYDLVLNVCKFVHGYAYNFCIKCMKRFESMKHFHTCLIPTMCQKCYTFHLYDEDELPNPIECMECFLNFKTEHCFYQHMFNKVFNKKLHCRDKVSPCQQFMYCSTCTQIVPRFFWQ